MSNYNILTGNAAFLPYVVPHKRKSQNAPVIYPTMLHSDQIRNMQISVLNEALRDIEQLHLGIWEPGQFHPYFQGVFADNVTDSPWAKLSTRTWTSMIFVPSMGMGSKGNSHNVLDFAGMGSVRLDWCIASPSLCASGTMTSWDDVLVSFLWASLLALILQLFLSSLSHFCPRRIATRIKLIAPITEKACNKCHN